MRRIIGIALIGCLGVAWTAAPSLSAETRKRAVKQSRTIHEEYYSPAGKVFVDHELGGGWYGCLRNRFGCLHLPVKETERYLVIKATDDSGLPVPIDVEQDVGPNGSPVIKSVCGETTKPLRIVPGVQVQLYFYPYEFDPVCPGSATQGTVTLTFSDKP